MNNKKKFKLFLDILGIKRVLTFITFSLGNVILELLSFSLFIPIIIIFSKTDKLRDNEIYNFISNFINFSNNKEVLFFLMLCMVVIFAIKNIYIAISFFIQTRISSNIELEITTKVLKNYLFKDYEFHIENNSSKIVRDVISEASMFCRSLLVAIINLFIEILVFIGIFFLIFFSEPQISILLTIYFSILGGSFYLMFKKKIKKIGEERQYNDKKRLQYLQQGIYGIKETLIYNLQTFIIQKFNIPNSIVIKNIYQNSLISQYPRLIFEFFAILALLIVFILYNQENKDISETVFVIGLIAAASFRLFPGINKILLSINQITYASPSINIVFDILKTSSNKALKQAQSIDFKDKIELKDINFKYKGSEKFVLDSINLKINKGFHIGIIGVTGSGKTTLIDLLIGLLNPTSGSINVDGVDILNNKESLRNIIGYVTQNPYILDDSILNNIAIGQNQKNINLNRVNSILKKIELYEHVNKLKDGVHTSIGERGVKLSGGQIQRVAIARAMYKEPKVLIFDEATSALDIQTEEEIVNQINKLKREKTIISISHKVKNLKYCDEIYKIENGKLIQQN